MILAACLFLGGVAVGYVIEGERQYRAWGRVAARVFTTAPIADLTPPTVTELRPGGPITWEDA